MVHFEPIGDFVIVKVLDSDMNVDGIILPEQENQQHVRGEVIAVGPGKHIEGSTQSIRHHMQVRVGDIVLVNSFRCAPETLPLEMEGKFMLIPETDIATIVRE